MGVARYVELKDVPDGNYFIIITKLNCVGDGG